MQTGNGALDGAAGILCKARHSTLLSLGDSEVALYFPADEKLLTVSSRISQMLSWCTRFRTIREHSRVILRALRAHPESEEHIINTLNQLLAAGLLMTKPCTASLPVQPQHSCPQKIPISLIVVLTKDRRNELLRCLDTVCSNLKHYSRHANILIVDDSRDAAANQVALEQLDTHSDCFMGYVNRYSRARFCDELAKRGISLETARFALLGWPHSECSIGASRNTAMLASIGRGCMMIDDDMAFRTCRHPNGSMEVRFSGHTDVLDAWPYVNRQDLFSVCKFEMTDVLAEHERFLGQSLGHIACHHSDYRFDNNVCEHVIGALRTGAGRVVLTCSGVVGDSGLHSNIGFLTASGGTRRRLLQGEEKYTEALASRYILRVAPAPTVVHESVCMAGNIAFDNRCILPPFMSSFRSEDRVFGMMLSKIDDESYTGHVPVAVMHLPDQERCSVAYFDGLVSVRVADLCLSLLDLIKIPELCRCPVERLSFIGEELTRCAHMNVSDFSNYARIAVLTRSSAILRNLLRFSIEQEDAPSYWTRVYDGVRRSLIDRMKVRDCWIPDEMRAQDNPAQMTQRFLSSLGKLCVAWPHILEVSRDLLDAGISLRITN